MKAFFYDTLLEEENICNLERQRRDLQAGIAMGKKLVVYGPRNFGKTSLVKNVVIPHFQKKHKESFVLFADLMEVKNLDAIHLRVQRSFEKAFSESFPKKNLLESVKKFLSKLKPEINMDPLTGAPTLSLGVSKEHSPMPFIDLFQLLHKKIAAVMPTLIVLDEFQDIAFVEEAQGLFRQALQEFSKTPVVLMGSKKHILADLFARPNAPLAGFGEDVEFEPIAYEKYHHYIQERFEPKGLTIDEATSQFLQDFLLRVPEAINMVCADLYEQQERKEITQNFVRQAVQRIIERRHSRFEEKLAQFSEKENEVLIALAKTGVVQQPNSKSFLKQIDATPRTVSLAITNLHNKTVIEKTTDGYRVADPLLYHFIHQFR